MQFCLHDIDQVVQIVTLLLYRFLQGIYIRLNVVHFAAIVFQSLLASLHAIKQGIGVAVIKP